MAVIIHKINNLHRYSIRWPTACVAAWIAPSRLIIDTGRINPIYASFRFLGKSNPNEKSEHGERRAAGRPAFRRIRLKTKLLQPFPRGIGAFWRRSQVDNQGSFEGLVKDWGVVKPNVGG